MPLLGASVDRLVDRDKVTPACGVALKDLIAQLGVEIDTASAGGGGPSTTTTTLPGTTCTGSLSVPPAFPNERNFTFACSAMRSYGPKSAICSRCPLPSAVT